MSEEGKFDFVSKEGVAALTMVGLVIFFIGIWAVGSFSLALTLTGAIVLMVAAITAIVVGNKHSSS